MMVVISVWLKKMDCRGNPLSRIWEEGAKPEPITCSVNWTEPAMMVAGLSDVTTGVGRLMTPPQELSASVAATRIIVRIFVPRPKAAFVSRSSPFQMPVLPPGQSGRLLKMMIGGNRDASAMSDFPTFAS
ncbi:MAG TPA: hypothetical protein VGT03_02915 [Candidatus Acidoferrales bacterium]|nr:hypothetical protein [Candidatus Acidoferrales bacterium]